MKILFLLITLTQNGAGDINASFVNTESLQQCQQKASMVEAVFTGAKIPVIASRCIQSELQFTEFAHASSTSKIRNFYLIKLDQDSLQITLMPDWRSCMQQQLNADNSNTIKPVSLYCSSSVQSLIQLP